MSASIDITGPIARLRRATSTTRWAARPLRRSLQLAIKMIIAGTLAWWLCVELGAPRPLFAVLVPLVAMGADPLGAVSISAARMAGVFIGVFVGLGLVQVPLPSTLLVLLLLTISLIGGLLIRIGGGPLNNQVAISAMFMLYLGVGDKAQTVGIDRIWETAIGAAVAVAVAVLVWPPDPLVEVRDRVRRLDGWLAEDLDRAAELLDDPDPVSADDQLRIVRERSREAVRQVLELHRAEHALRLNPRHRPDASAFEIERGRLTSSARQYRHLRSLMRTIADISEQRPLPDPDRAQLARYIVDHPPTQPLGASPGGSPDLMAIDDPRAAAIAIQLKQMTADLARAAPLADDVR